MTRIVIVDDDAGLRLIVGHLLDELGHEIVGETDNALYGAEMARWADVVLLDWSVPGMTGEDAVRTIHEFAPTASVVVLSSFESDPHAIDALGIAAWVDKADLDELGDVLQSLVIAA